MKKVVSLFLLCLSVSISGEFVDRASIIQTDIVPFVQSEEQDYEVRSLTDQLGTTEVALEQAEQDIESLTDKLHIIDSLIDQAELSVDSLTDELGVTESLLDVAEQEVISLTDALVGQESTLDVLENTIDSLTDYLGATVSLLDVAESNIESLADEIGTTESLIEQAEQAVASLIDELGTTDSLLDQAEFTVESLTDDLGTADSLLDVVEFTVESLVDELGTTDSLLDQAEFEIESIVDELGTTDSLLDQAELTIDSLNDELVEPISLLDGLDQTVESLVDELGTTGSLLDQAENAIESLSDELGTTDSLLDAAELTVESLIDDLAGSDSLIDRAEVLLHDDSIPASSSLDLLASRYAETNAFAGVNPETDVVNRITTGLNPYLDAALNNLNNVIWAKSANGESHTVVLAADGSLYACGNDGSGQLGIGGLGNQHILVAMTDPGFSGMPIAIAAGDAHTVVVTDDGSVYACGNDGSGQLGIGGLGNQNILVAMTDPGFSGVPLAVSAGREDSFVLTVDGSLYSCGLNYSGQLGVGDTSEHSTLVTMTDPGFSGTPVAIAAGESHTIVLTDNGSLYACGYNFRGALGLGFYDANPHSTLVAMNNPSGGFSGTPVAIAAGKDHTIVLTDDGSLYGCGWNSFGALGLGDNTQRNTLTLIGAPTGGFSGVPVAIAAGNANTYIVTDEGVLYGCGYNAYYQLSINTNTAQYSLVPMLSPYAGFKGKPVAIAGTQRGRYTTLVTDNAVVYACGENTDGQLGVGNTTLQNRLVAMDPNLKVNVGVVLD